MTIKSLGMSDVVRWHPNNGYYFYSRNITKEDTCICIASAGQTSIRKVLKDSKEINILFESEMAVNKKPGHGTAPRNTVIVFELKD